MQLISSDYPWHDRTTTHQHHRWFERLRRIHRLSLEWAGEKDLRIEGLPEPFSNPWTPDLLSAFMDTPLESFLDDTDPSDVLIRLEYSVWTAHSLAMRRSASEPSRLGQDAWRLGRVDAESRWKNMDTPSSESLKDWIHALSDIPFAHTERGAPFLIRRVTSSEAEIELLSCAHESAHPDVAAHGAELCSLHGQWICGFSYGLHPRIASEYLPRSNPGERCRIRWQRVLNPIVPQ